MDLAGFIHRHRKEINNEIEDLKEQVSLGQCSSYEEYKGAVGKLNGFKICRDKLTETLKTLEEDDEHE
jgi:hypothetical protein